jgi:hypothetical protein
MTLKTKARIFFIGLIVIVLVTVVLVIMKSPYAKAGIAAFLLWFSTVPTKRSKQDEKDVRDTSPADLRDDLTPTASSSIAASPGEVENIIDSGLREAFDTADKQRGQGNIDPVSSVDRKDNH